MFTQLKHRFFGGKKVVRKPIRRDSVKLNLEALEERWCPATDIWQAHSAGTWSNGSDWSLGAPPSSGDTAVFDSNYSYFSCTVNENTPEVNIQIANSWGSQLIVNPGYTLNVNNFTDGNPGYDSFDVQYNTSGGSGGQMIINGTAKFYNLGISDSTPSAPAGSTTFASTATVTMGDGGGYNINVEDAITDQGTWNIGATSGGYASTIIANDQVDPPWTIDHKLNINSANQAATLANAKNGMTYINVVAGGEADFWNVGAFKQTMKIGLLEKGGTVKFTGGTWDFTQAIPAATLTANGATRPDDDIYVIGGTFQLGSTTQKANVTVSYADDSEVQGSAASGASVKVSGGNGTIQTLIPDNASAGAYFEYGSIQFDDYNEQLKLGYSLFAPNNGNTFQINMYANCGQGKAQDEIVAVTTNGNWGDLHFYKGATVNMYLKNPGTDTEAKGTFDIIDDSAFGILDWEGTFNPVNSNDTNNGGAGGIFTYTH